MKCNTKRASGRGRQRKFIRTKKRAEGGRLLRRVLAKRARQKLALKGIRVKKFWTHREGNRQEQVASRKEENRDGFRNHKQQQKEKKI